MESIREVKQALTARSQTKSLDELQSGGRKRVKVIRAEHIAAMIDEAVQRAIAESGLIPREEVDRLVEKSRSEFASVHAERQRESQELHDARHDLGEAVRRRDAFASQVGSLEEDVAALERELASARERVNALEAELESVTAGTPAATAGTPAAGMPPDMMMKMMEELANLKARVAVGGGQAAPAAPVAPAAPAAPQGDVFSSALEKLTASMTDRLEQMGRKMGISGAVEADAVKLDGLLSDLADQKVESNLDTMEVKQRQAGGIAANLARLKKLKGGD